MGGIRDVAKAPLKDAENLDYDSRAGMDWRFASVPSRRAAPMLPASASAHPVEVTEI